MWKGVETAPQHTKENDMRQIKITFVALLLAIATALPTMAGNEPVKDPDTLTTEYRNTQYIDTIRNLNINVDYPTVANGKLKVSVLRYEAETLANTAQMLSFSYDAKATAYDGDSTDFGNAPLLHHAPHRQHERNRQSQRHRDTTLRYRP